MVIVLMINRNTNLQTCYKTKYKDFTFCIAVSCSQLFLHLILLQMGPVGGGRHALDVFKLTDEMRRVLITAIQGDGGNGQR